MNKQHETVSRSALTARAGLLHWILKSEAVRKDENKRKLYARPDKRAAAARETWLG